MACRSAGCWRPDDYVTGIQSRIFELFAYEPIRTVRDLKGKRFGVPTFGSAPHLLLSVMAAHVGLDPKDIDWIVSPTGYLHRDARQQGGRCLSWVPVGATGAPCPRARSRHSQHDHRTAVVGTTSVASCSAIASTSAAHSIATKRVLRAVRKTTTL